MQKPDETNTVSNHDGESIQQEVDVFTREVALLYFRMKVAAQQYLGQGRHSTGRRGLLKSLGEEGPQTVPQMARVRAVSRQHIQTVVNELRRDGLAKTKDNPKHRRSKLVTLTSAGHEFLETLHEREGELMSFLGEGISQQDFKQATSLVRLVRERLESEEWTALANPDHLRSQ